MKPDDYRTALQQYRELRGDYQIFSELLQGQLRTLADGLGMYPIVMGRAKSLESLAEKLVRPGKDYAGKNPLGELTDLAGVRLILHTLDQVDTVADEVGRRYLVDEENSEDKQSALAPVEFGYLSRHFIIQLRDGDVPSEAELREAVPQLGEWSVERSSRMATFKAELQLRTIAQHAWADIHHEFGYKNEFKLPLRWQREFARLAAQLESCDRGFQEIKDQLTTYESTYESYLSKTELMELRNRLEILIDVAPATPQVLHRLIRVHLALGDRKESLGDLLEQHEETLQSYPPALRDLGIAYTQLGKPGSTDFALGQEMLTKAVAADPRDIDALCSLGGTYRKENKRFKAADCYRRAHYNDPSNPYPLGNFLVEEMLRTGTTDVVDHARALLDGALERCRKQVEVKVNLPWALFDLGILKLSLGRVDESVAGYAAGIALASDSWMIKSAGEKTIAALFAAQVPLPGLDVVKLLLDLGMHLHAGEPIELAKAPAEVSDLFAGKPVLVIAGGCDGLEAEIRPQLDALADALSGYQGTIVSGGTKSGIAEFVGDLQVRAGVGVETIGYVPSLSTPGLRDRLNERYTHHRHSDGDGFSVRESLTFWRDLIAVGGDPQGVALIGFNGGKISAAEYRIARAFGARVGIVAGSGREADRLLAESLWKNDPRIERLVATDCEGIVKFVTAADQ